LINSKLYLLKIKIALFFSLLFISILVTPTVISLTDASQNIACFLDLNEDEEENNGKEESKIDTEIKLQPSSSYKDAIVLKNEQTRTSIRFFSKKYTCKYLKVTTPPPKIIL